MTRWRIPPPPPTSMEPIKGTNVRELDFSRARRAETQQLAMFPADLMPPPAATGPVPLNRKAGVERVERAELPAQARRRLQSQN